MSEQPPVLPPVPSAYRRSSLIGGLVATVIVLIWSGLMVPALLAERVPHTLAGFELNWQPETAELLLEGDLLDSPERVSIVLQQSLPAHFFQQAHPLVFYVEGLDYWETESVPAWLAPVVLLAIGFFAFVAGSALYYWAIPRWNLRRVRQAPRRVEALMIATLAGSARRAGSPVQRVIFQALIDGVVWRYEYRTATLPTIVTADGPRPPQPGDRFAIYCLAHDPRVYVVPQTLRPA